MSKRYQGTDDDGRTEALSAEKFELIRWKRINLRSLQIENILQNATQLSRFWNVTKL